MNVDQVESLCKSVSTYQRIVNPFAGEEDIKHGKGKNSMKPIPMPENVVKKREALKTKRAEEIAEVERKNKNKVIKSKNIKGKR